MQSESFPQRQVSSFTAGSISLAPVRGGVYQIRLDTEAEGTGASCFSADFAEQTAMKR